MSALARRFIPWIALCSLVASLGFAFSPARAAYGTVSFRDVTYDSVTLDVRTGPDVNSSIPYGQKMLRKGDHWEVEGNLPIFWRRELNPGSSDGKFTDWQRVVPNGDERIDI